MKRKLFIIIPLSVLFMTMFFSCGPKPVPPASVLDTPDNHFNQGIRELDRGNLTEAEAEFNKSIQLDPDYAEGYSGLGLVWATRKDFKQAHDFADKGLGKNKNSLDARIIKGRIITMERKGDDWVKDAIKEFDKASEINPNSDKPLYYKGTTYKQAYMFRESENVFSQVVAMKGDYAKAANEEWSLVQKIVRAAPGTKVGAKIALIREIDRADLAVLFMEELKLLEIIEKKRPKEYDTSFQTPDDPTQMQTSQTTHMAEVTDIDDHWAKNWIKDIVKAKGIDVYPDHTFRPDEKITRSNYANLIQNILIMATGEEELATKYIGTPSRFPDVNASHFAYNAVCLAVDRGIMHADKMTGAFEMNKTVSGADALLIIRDFQNALRMTF